MDNNTVKGIRDYLKKREQMADDNRWNENIHKLDRLYFNGQKQAIEEILKFIEGKHYINDKGEFIDNTYGKLDLQTRYFEFNQHEYYALIAVKDEPVKDALEKAYEQYVEYVGGDNVEMIKEEGEPDEITRNEAMLKYFQGKGCEDETVRKLTEQFERVNEAPLLIDGGLL